MGKRQWALRVLTQRCSQQSHGNKKQYENKIQKHVLDVNSRRWLTRLDFLVIGALISVAAALLWVFSLAPQGGQVVIEQNGENVLSVAMPINDIPEQFEVKGDDGIRLIVEIGQNYAAVTHANCPDQTCVKTGKIRRTGESVLCLPAKTIVKIGGSVSVDAVTY